MGSSVRSSFTSIPDILNIEPTRLPKPVTEEVNTRSSSISSGSSSIASAAAEGGDDESWMSMLPPLPAALQSPLWGEADNELELDLRQAALAPIPICTPAPLQAPNGFYDLRPHSYVYRMNGGLAACYKILALSDSDEGLLSFEAENLATHEVVTLKTNRPKSDPGHSLSCALLDNEIAILKKLRNNYFTPLIHDVFKANSEQSVLVLERFKTHNFLNHRFNDAKRPCWSQLISVTFQMLNALNHFREKGIVHDNLSPEKLSIDESMQLKVEDFRRAYTSCAPKASSLLNIYSAPETCLKLRSGSAEDVWSAGRIITDLAAGQILAQSSSVGENPIRTITKCRGVPPKEWLDASSITTQFFIKGTDGHYSFLDDRGKLDRPVDRFVECITDVIKDRWSNETFPEELHQFIDLINKMTSYQKRITPMQALHHPLFDNYVFWQISQTGKNPVTNLFISFVNPCKHWRAKSDHLFLNIDFSQHPKSRWLFHNCESQTTRYKLRFYNKHSHIITNELSIGPRAILEVGSDSAGNHSLQVSYVVYKKDSREFFPPSTSSATTSTSSHSLSLVDSSSGTKQQSLTGGSVSSTRSNKRTSGVKPLIKPPLGSKEIGPSLPSSSTPLSTSLGKRSSQALQSAVTTSKTPERSGRSKRTKKM